jgi:Fur family transcriptional regulator, ferric uptake regulator
VSGVSAASVHEQAALRLDGLDQRYTAVRRALVTTLADAGRPLSVPEILEANTALPQSSAYRNVTALIEAGVVRRVTGIDDHGRFELSEDLAGHHHHLACARCGTVEDVVPSSRLERAMDEAARAIADEQGYEVISHQFDLVGTCPACREASGPSTMPTARRGADRTEQA